MYTWGGGNSIPGIGNSRPMRCDSDVGTFVFLVDSEQTSDKRAVETTDVTKSFGWDSSEGKVGGFN